MGRFRKISLDGVNLYRRIDETTGYMDEKVVTEDIFAQEAFTEIVEEVIEVDIERVNRGIASIPQEDLREDVQTYIDYLQSIIKSLA